MSTKQSQVLRLCTGQTNTKAMVYKQSIHKEPAQSHKLDLQIIQLRNNSSTVTLTPSNLQGLLRQRAVSQCIASMLKVIICDTQIK